MNLFYFVLWQFMIIVVCGRRSEPINPMRDDNLQTLTLQFNINGVITNINLQQVNRVLVNEFLPVWMTNNDGRKEFRKLDIMDNVGEFITYHDDCTKSAFVYFHERHELDGIVDVTYYVKGLPIDETKSVQVVHEKYLHHVMSFDDPVSRAIRSLGNVVKRQTQPHKNRDVYVEILVALSHDTCRAIEQASNLPQGVATVSHMITVYNAVDMLYKFVRKTNVQLNIAGIVIEALPNQWGFMSERSNSELYIDVKTIHPMISKYFWLRQNHFPRHSYDIIVYHTRTFLEYNISATVLGAAMPTTSALMFPPDYHKDRFVLVVKDLETYQHFKTITHEMAHLFGAKHDGKGAYGHVFNLASCGSSLMAKQEHCSRTCLDWSGQAEVELALFFRGPVYCNLKNYPRSLSAPRPRQIFSREEQCQCYGHEFDSEADLSVPQKECGRPLMCRDSFSGQLKEVPLPMDGTPCGARKVCWNKVCKKYGKNFFRGRRKDGN